MNAASSAALIAQIDQLAVPHGQLALWSLGQAGFVIKGGATIAYIDPYLSGALAEGGGPGRRFPVPIDPQTIQHAQIIFATHEHGDHADVLTLGPLMAASPHATLVTTPQGRDWATGRCGNRAHPGGAAGRARRIGRSGLHRDASGTLHI